LGQKKKRNEEKAEEEMEEEMPVEWCEWVANWLSQMLVEQSWLGKKLAEVQREMAELRLFELFYHMEESNKRLDSKVEKLVRWFVGE
jgi:hypothetical protein